MTSQDIRQLLLQKVKDHHFLKNIQHQEVVQAIDTCLNLFPDSAKPLFDGILHLQVAAKHAQAVNILDEALPALIFSHRYFGSDLPERLIQKIQNPTQVADTFFELKCLGVFQEKHEIVYEPKLVRKIPDFKILLQDGRQIYVECKAQRGGQESLFSQVFQKVSHEISSAIAKGRFVSSAWAKGLRTEIIPAKTIDAKEVAGFVKVLENTDPSNCITNVSLTDNITVVCIPREKPICITTSMRQGWVTVTDKPTHIGHENTHLIIHSWPGLDIKRRRTQRKLLAEARRKLREIPKGSLGMICIQAYSANLFLPDIMKLVAQPEYHQVPLIWLNPFNSEGKIVCRNEYLPLRDQLFGTLIH